MNLKFSQNAAFLRENCEDDFSHEYSD